MFRAMFSAINGLEAHSTAMDVVGHNLANVNTVGYKKMRPYFQDLFYQNLASATAPTATRPGRNPVQVGLGSQVAAIDTIFSQGSFETTGRSTDVAIEGRGFFIVRYGDQTFYTRAGNFSFESHGFLVDPNGYKVQGFSFNEQTGEWEPTLTDIYINPNEQLPPRQTDILTLKANLSSNATGSTFETWRIGPFKNSASQTVSASAMGSLLLINSCAAEDISTGDYIEIIGNKHDGESVTGRFYLNSAGTTATVGGQNVDSFTSSVTVHAGDSVEGGYVIIVSASDTDKGLIGKIYGPGDTIDSTGDVKVKLVGTYEDLVRYIQYLYGDRYTVKWENGRIFLIDETCGPSLMTIRMNFVDGDVSGSSFQVPEITREIEGKYADTFLVTQTIYDRTGQAHELKIHFVKVQGEDADDNGSFFSASATDDPSVRKNTWVFYTELDGQILEVDGAAGRVDFDTSGNPRITYYYAHFPITSSGGTAEYDVGAFGSVPTGSGIEICPDERCPNNLKIDIDGDGLITFQTTAGGTLQAHIRTLNEEGAELGIHLETYNPDLFSTPLKLNVFDELGNVLLTTMGGESRVYYVDQNGYPPGDLVEISIDDNGVVQAQYSNGKTLKKYRLALAGFNNEQGLKRMGHGLFAATPASGNPFIAAPGVGGLGNVKSGTLELSNVDIAEEFTKMILFQRGFQANARVITTSDEMLQDIIALKR